MAAMLEKRYEPFWNKLLTHPVQGIQDEMNTFGARHDYIGVMSARQWGFGATQEEQEMIVAIQEHHNVAEVAHFKNERIRLLVATGMLAEVIVNNVNGQVYMSEESIYMRDMALHVLCIDEETLATIRRNSLSRLIFS